MFSVFLYDPRAHVGNYRKNLGKLFRLWCWRVDYYLFASVHVRTSFHQSVRLSLRPSVSQSVSFAHRLIDCIVDKKLPYNTYQHLELWKIRKVEKCFAALTENQLREKKKTKTQQLQNLPTYFLVDSNLILSPCYFLHVASECNRPQTCKVGNFWAWRCRLWDMLMVGLAYNVSMRSSLMHVIWTVFKYLTVIALIFWFRFRLAALKEILRVLVFYLMWH